MSRGNNPHTGVMISYWVSKPVYASLCKLKKKTGRCLIDIFDVAVKHRLAYPTMYELDCVDSRPIRKKLRVSKAYAIELAELAWNAGLSRSRYVADTATLFLHFIDYSALCNILIHGRDIMNRVLE